MNSFWAQYYTTFYDQNELVYDAYTRSNESYRFVRHLEDAYEWSFWWQFSIKALREQRIN